MQILPPPISDEQLARAQQIIQRDFDGIVGQLKDLVRIPGIAWEAFDAKNLQTSAHAIKDLLERIGCFETVEILTADYDQNKTGSPAIVATRAAKNGKPTFLLYAHHDVQPPGNLEAWRTDPFEPTEKEGRLFGRGAADDKAGVMAHLSSVAALKELAGQDFDIGIVIFIEGEEEAGSPSFANFLEKYQDRLEADVIIVADSGNWSTEVPAITTTLRGLASIEFEVKTLDHALHSGMFGGAVPDAMLALTKILASMWNEKGEVTISGLKSSENVALSYSEDQLRVDSGLLPSTLPIGSGPILSRIWTKPSLTLIGLDYPQVDVSSNTLIPSVRAKLSLRIAPGQEPELALEALKAHILANNPFQAEIRFGAVELGRPFSQSQSGWAKILAENALRLAYGQKSVDIGIGGSIPFIAELEKVFPSAQVLVTGVEDPDSRAHSPNESLHLHTFKAAIVSQLLILLAGNQITL